mmetsp:Transcript_682/g.2418  ORF Transcript_682/g.2418 Transcript_682/m.2418 type:complete len:234 (-) Transcript_682:396-1097(-)
MLNNDHCWVAVPEKLQVESPRASKAAAVIPSGCARSTLWPTSWRAADPQRSHRALLSEETARGLALRARANLSCRRSPPRQGKPKHAQHLTPPQTHLPRAIPKGSRYATLCSPSASPVERAPPDSATVPPGRAGGTEEIAPWAPQTLRPSARHSLGSPKAPFAHVLLVRRSHSAQRWHTTRIAVVGGDGNRGAAAGQAERAATNRSQQPPRLEARERPDEKAQTKITGRRRCC